mmetsp:Transcript_37652/g.120022  ORF Transcript_37652/g.120022 Transcript_37652/m.120022 type:complete len:211 (-) Transcript_37652:7-639(-)
MSKTRQIGDRPKQLRVLLGHLVPVLLIFLAVLHSIGYLQACPRQVQRADLAVEDALGDAGRVLLGSMLASDVIPLVLVPPRGPEARKTIQGSPRVGPSTPHVQEQRQNGGQQERHRGGGELERPAATSRAAAGRRRVARQHLAPSRRAQQATRLATVLDVRLCRGLLRRRPPLPGHRAPGPARRGHRRSGALASLPSGTAHGPAGGEASP